MIVGHLPAGYLAATAVLDRLGLPRRKRQTLLAAALVASVAPDVDLIAFYATGGHVHHHAYPTHWPLLWIVLTVAGLSVAALRRNPTLALGAAFVGAAALLHLALDSIAGAVRWGAPFSDHVTTLVHVPARHASWVASLMLHWTFGVEVALTVVAGVVLWSRRGRSATPPQAPRVPRPPRGRAGA